MNKLSLSLRVFGVVLAIILMNACAKSDSVDIQETGQQVGDVMASVDESGGSNGSLGRGEEETRVFQRLEKQGVLSRLSEGLLPTAYATSCALATTFGSCGATASNTIVRTFGDCTILGTTLSGTVTLTWGGAATSCAMTAATGSVTRVPAFTITGRRGATLTVSKTGTIGQKLTWASGTGTSKVFAFSNDGIRRVFTTSGGTTLFDYTTTTTTDLSITGTTRATRTLTAGTLRVTNNVTAVTCDYTPSNVAWTSTCNCAASGSWSGSCSDGKTTTLTLTGCGTGDLAIGSSTQSVTFDRCYGI